MRKRAAPSTPGSASSLAFALGDLTLAGVRSVRNAFDALRSARGRATTSK
jgi:hypothetical protein